MSLIDEANLELKDVLIVCDLKEILFFCFNFFC